MHQLKIMFLTRNRARTGCVDTMGVIFSLHALRWWAEQENNTMYTALWCCWTYTVVLPVPCLVVYTCKQNRRFFNPTLASRAFAEAKNLLVPEPKSQTRYSDKPLSLSNLHHEGDDEMITEKPPITQKRLAKTTWYEKPCCLHTQLTGTYFARIDERQRASASLVRVILKFAHRAHCRIKPLSCAAGEKKLKDMGIYPHKQPEKRNVALKMLGRTKWWKQAFARRTGSENVEFSWRKGVIQWHWFTSRLPDRSTVMCFEICFVWDQW